MSEDLNYDFVKYGMKIKRVRTKCMGIGNET